MTPTPTQIAEWREKIEASYSKTDLPWMDTKTGKYRNFELQKTWEIYLALCTEQATEIAELKAKLEHHRKLFSRCLEVLSTLEGECDTESEMLDALKSDVKAVMGIAPLIAGSLI